MPTLNIVLIGIPSGPHFRRLRPKRNVCEKHKPNIDNALYDVYRCFSV